MDSKGVALDRFKELAADRVLEVELRRQRVVREGRLAGQRGAHHARVVVSALKERRDAEQHGLGHTASAGGGVSGGRGGGGGGRANGRAHGAAAR